MFYVEFYRWVGYIEPEIDTIVIYTTGLANFKVTVRLSLISHYVWLCLWFAVREFNFANISKGLSMLSFFLLRIFLRSADNVGRPFCCCIVFSLLFIFFNFFSFPLSAFCDFSAIFHRISFIFGQLVDNNLQKSCIHFGIQRSKVKVTRWH